MKRVAREGAQSRVVVDVAPDRARSRHEGVFAQRRHEVGQELRVDRHVGVGGDDVGALCEADAQAQGRALAAIVGLLDKARVFEVTVDLRARPIVSSLEPSSTTITSTLEGSISCNVARGADSPPPGGRTRCRPG